jgi:hypothetical protein
VVGCDAQAFVPRMEIRPEENPGMEPRETKPVANPMRALHRDLGYFVVGLTVVYALSGIVQVYRDVDFMKRETHIEKQLPPGLEPADVGLSLRIRDFKVTRTEGDTVYFRGGLYDRGSGRVAYTAKDFVFPMDRFVRLHKASSKSPAHGLATVYGALLLFLAVSSFWMFRSGTTLFRRGVSLAAAGVVVAVAVLFL